MDLGYQVVQTLPSPISFFFNMSCERQIVQATLSYNFILGDIFFVPIFLKTGSFLTRSIHGMIIILLYNPISTSSFLFIPEVIVQQPLTYKRIDIT